MQPALRFGSRPGPSRELGAELAELVVEVRERAGEVGVLEAGRLRTRCILRACSSAGRPRARRGRSPTRPSCSRFESSQFALDTLRPFRPLRRRRRADAAARASRGPPRAPARGRPSRALSSSARKDWKSRSPISSSSFASSPASAASATSYASSTVCGTIVRAVCSRSHGQSRRRRSVSSWSSTSASARPHQGR